MRNRYQAVVVVLIVSLLFACWGKKSDTVLPEKKVIKPSPTKVVQELLRAWQKEDFEKAYGYVYVPYTDKDGYVIQMKNYFKDNQIAIHEFRVLGTQVFDRTAMVVVELKQSLKSPNTGSVVELTQKSQYELGIFDDKWKVTAGNCIANCLETEHPIGGPSK
ncbi:MAG: hypothetical protein ACHQ6U_13150 [Thermodesulfobacteriota bacterium]